VSAFSWRYAPHKSLPAILLDRFGVRLVYRFWLDASGPWQRCCQAWRKVFLCFFALCGCALRLVLTAALVPPANSNIVAALFPRAERAALLAHYASIRGGICGTRFLTPLCSGLLCLGLALFVVAGAWGFFCRPLVAAISRNPHECEDLSDGE